ncbi:MAG: hypothetical protein ACI3XA_09645 [Clostridia bacterium]
MNDKPIYSQKVKNESNGVQRTVLFIITVVLLCVALFFVNLLPYRGILSVGVIFIFAFITLKLLNGFVFDLKYVLYEDRIAFVRKYGRLEWESIVFFLNETEIKDNEIVFMKKSYPFYPDEKMKELLSNCR